MANGSIAALLLSCAMSPPDEDPLDPARLARLAARCGSEIPWLTTWKEAAARAREEKRPVVMLVRNYRDMNLPDMTNLVTFMDEAIVALIRDRFVPLRFRIGDDAPFVAQEGYGMGPSTFGTSILVADADGKVGGDTFTFETSTLHAFLVDQLPAESRPPHQVSGEAGVRAIEATERDAAPERLPALAVEKAELLARLGRRDEAFASIDRVPEDHAQFPRALFLRGMLGSSQPDLEPARAAWTRLLRDHEENRYAWLAAAALPLGLLEGGNGGVEPWPAAEIAATLQRRPLEPLGLADLGRAEATAVAFLLDTQRPDGSWICPGEVLSPVDRRDEPLVVAITALCAHSLLPYASEGARDPRIEQAIPRALAFLRECCDRAPPVATGMMDYRIWSRPSLIRCIAAAVDAGFAEPDDWHEPLQACVDAMLKVQKKGGGFSYYNGPDAEKPDPSLEISFSFVTAYALRALADARALGQDVPEEAIARAVGCLVRSRNADGSFEYGLAHANESAGRRPTPAGSAGRGPLCALALQRFGRGDLDAVRRSLDRFHEHRATYAHEQGKTLMHCGLEGQGSHYLMFDYLFIAEAIAALPKGEWARWRPALLEQILAARSDAGSYVDNPILGDHVGTGLALLAFRALARTE